jgi:hypothetical protein
MPACRSRAECALSASRTSTAFRLGPRAAEVGDLRSDPVDFDGARVLPVIAKALKIGCASVYRVPGTGAG